MRGTIEWDINASIETVARLYERLRVLWPEQSEAVPDILLQRCWDDVLATGTSSLTIPFLADVLIARIKARFNSKEGAPDARYELYEYVRRYKHMFELCFAQRTELVTKLSCGLFNGAMAFLTNADERWCIPKNDREIISNTEHQFLRDHGDALRYLSGGMVLTFSRVSFVNTEPTGCAAALVALREAYAYYRAGAHDSARESMDWAHIVVGRVALNRGLYQEQLYSMAFASLAAADAAQDVSRYDDYVLALQIALEGLPIDGNDRAETYLRLGIEYDRRRSMSEALAMYRAVLSVPNVSDEVLRDMAAMGLEVHRAYFESNAALLTPRPRLAEALGLGIDEWGSYLRTSLQSQEGGNLRTAEEDIAGMKAGLRAAIDLVNRKQRQSAFDILVMTLRIGASLRECDHYPTETLVDITRLGQSLVNYAEPESKAAFQQLKAVVEASPRMRLEGWLNGGTTRSLPRTVGATQYDGSTNSASATGDVATWMSRVADVVSITSASMRLSRIRDVVAAYLHERCQGTSGPMNPFPIAAVLGSTAAAAEQLYCDLPTSEAALWERTSQRGLIGYLVDLVWTDVTGVSLALSADVVQETVDLDCVPDATRDILVQLHFFLDRMSEWRLRHQSVRRFASSLQSTPSSDRSKYQKLCETVAQWLWKSDSANVGRKALKEDSFREAMDRLREFRTVLQLRYGQSNDRKRSSDQKEADATMHIVPVGARFAVIVYDGRRAHFWCSRQWSEAISTLDQSMKDVELSHRFDEFVQVLLADCAPALEVIMGDNQGPMPLRFVRVVEHCNLRAPIGDILNRGMYAAPRSKESKRLGGISFWGRITYRENERYSYDDRSRIIYQGAASVLKYPDPPDPGLHPDGDPVPLLLASYEKWQLEDLCQDYGIPMRSHCDCAATRDAFITQDLSENTILHVSTHGEAFAETWELSNIKLACRGGHPERVHAFDVLARDWSQLELVFLNACLSSAGKHTAGEQPLSLGWAFRAAGAKYVIAARWPIEDVVAFEFVRLFYSHLLADSEATISEAFHLSVHQLKSGPHCRKPSQWMSFVLM